MSEERASTADPIRRPLAAGLIRRYLDQFRGVNDITVYEPAPELPIQVRIRVLRWRFRDARDAELLVQASERLGEHFNRRVIFEVIEGDRFDAFGRVIADTGEQAPRELNQADARRRQAAQLERAAARRSRRR